MVDACISMHTHICACKQLWTLGNQACFQTGWVCLLIKSIIFRHMHAITRSSSSLLSSLSCTKMFSLCIHSVHEGLKWADHGSITAPHNNNAQRSRLPSLQLQGFKQLFLPSGEQGAQRAGIHLRQLAAAAAAAAGSGDAAVEQEEVVAAGAGSGDAAVELEGAAAGAGDAAADVEAVAVVLAMAGAAAVVAVAAGAVLAAAAAAVGTAVEMEEVAGAVAAAAAGVAVAAVVAGVAAAAAPDQWQHQTSHPAPLQLLAPQAVAQPAVWPPLGCLWWWPPPRSAAASV